MFGTKNKPTPDLELFTIYDSKTESYRAPLMAVNRHELIRDTQNMFADPAQAKNTYLLNAEDFAIFKVGEFDRKTGVLTPVPHEHVANMHDLRAVVQKRTPPVGLDIGQSGPQGH